MISFDAKQIDTKAMARCQKIDRKVIHELRFAIKQINIKERSRLGFVMNLFLNLFKNLRKFLEVFAFVISTLP